MMKIYRTTTQRWADFRRGVYLLALGMALLAFGAGCATVQDLLDNDGDAEIALQNPPAYGTITQVTAASMADKENRQGDVILTVDLDNGQVVMIIQSEDNIYMPGDRVRVLRDGKKFVRVQVL